ncbi:MAG: peptidyl-prolyl cis-trans isomerase [Treponema bryantii]|nr:peptidyl-prolyl cis-trans isomerase [Treponema bryantii]
MKKIVLAFTMFLATAGMAFAQADLQPIVTVKLGKSETITVKQLKSRVGLFEKQTNKKLTVDERKSVLEAFVEEKLILQAAAKAGLSIPDSNIDQYFLQTMMQQIGVPFSSEKELDDIILQTQGVTLDQFLKNQLGISKAEYKSYMKNQLISQNYVVSQRQAELQKIGPTDEQIRAFYEANKASLVWTDMMKIFAIAVPKGSNPEQAKLTANDLRNKIVDKKLTSEQALVQSQKPDAGYQAIEGVIQKNETYAMQLGIPLQTLLTMFNQKEGFVSDIQETESDYRVFVLKKKYEAKMLSISDVVQPETTMTVYEYIRQNLANQMQSLYLQNAANEIAKSLNTPENVEYKKTGDALTKILNWGE